MITCRECGAQIEELTARCPYCGAINELGAEHKYMHDMYRLKGNLENLRKYSVKRRLRKK